MEFNRTLLFFKIPFAFRLDVSSDGMGKEIAFSFPERNGCRQCNQWGNCVLRRTGPDFGATSGHGPDSERIFVVHCDTIDDWLKPRLGRVIVVNWDRGSIVEGRRPSKGNSDHFHFLMATISVCDGTACPSINDEIQKWYDCLACQMNNTRRTGHFSAEEASPRVILAKT
jgi:hypothetical protein